MLQGLLESLPLIQLHSDISPSSGYNSGEPATAPGLMAPERPHPSPITTLALETLEEIIAFAPSESHLALALVSKVFYALCVRPIYTDLSLTSPAIVVKCCRTLLQNRFAASAVRTFEISYSPTVFRPLERFYELVGRTLQKLSNVYRLSLLVPDYHYNTVLARCLLPRLNHLNCSLSLEETMVAFLNRHRQISYLQLAPHEVVPLPRDPIVSLPKLEYFIGNSSAVAPVLHGAASLRAAFITWDKPAEHTEESLSALGRSSTDTLNFLACRRQGWNIDLLDRISTHLPHIYSLSLTNIFFTDTALTLLPANLQTIATYLSRFSSLQRLAITCVNVYTPWLLPAMQMDDAFETVTTWGSACPSLEECTLPQSDTIKWVRVCDNLWLPDPAAQPKPDQEGPSTSGARWIWNRLRTRRYPGWDRIVDTIGTRSGSRRRATDAIARLVALRTAALAREYDSTNGEDEDSDANVVAAGLEMQGIRFGGAGWLVEDYDDEDDSG